MYLRKCKNSKTGKTQLTIVQGYRDEFGKARQKTIQSLGYLEDLINQYPDPIAHFEALAKTMTSQAKEQKAPFALSLSTDETLPLGSDFEKNFGYAAISKVYHELGIHSFLTSRQRSSKAQYNHSSIFFNLVASRLIDPCSKKRTFEHKDQFFEHFDFSLDDIYRSLPFFHKHKAALQLWIHQKISEQYHRDTSLVYYDVTNFYFEIDEQDEMKRRGVSKEHRPDPIVQMGLFMDTMGIPISYGLFSGNTLDKQTLIPMMDKLPDDYKLGRVIVVADRGMITGDNIFQTLSDGNGYVLSYSIRGATKEFQNYVLDPEGYRKNPSNEESGFRIKSRLSPRQIQVTNPLTGKKKNVMVDEKHVVFYSPQYAKKTRTEREETLAKAKELIKEPSKYTRATSYGAAKYIQNITFSKETGEVVEKAGQALTLDEELIASEAQFDGYYAIVTSEWKESDERILDIYRGLWKIEESFRITKSDLDTRPIYLSILEHIEAHFLVCFVALVIARLLEHRLGGKYAVNTILESLRKATCHHIQENIYLFHYYDEILMDISNAFDIDFSKKYRTLGEIKKILSHMKKKE